MDPARLLEEVRRRSAKVVELRVLWATVRSEDRDELAADLRRIRGELPLVPLVLRMPGLFRDPNAVMNDVALLLEDARCEIEELSVQIDRLGGMGLLVLSRSELRIAVTSSPLVLPDWFPVAPGKAVGARIDDLTWSTYVLLSDGVVERNDLQRLLYETDVALVTRVRRVMSVDRRRGQSLWDLTRSENESNIGEALEQADQKLQARHPTNYRPHTRDRGPLLVGRLWSETNRRSPDRLRKLSEALADALGADELDVGAQASSLAAVLNRPTQPIPDEATRWCFYLIVTIRSACQLVTAAMHSDEYPMFPDTLLRAVSLDLRRFLDDAVPLLEAE